MVGGLEDGPKGLTIDGVICFPQVNKAYVQGTMEFPCSHSAGFHTIQDGFCEDLAGGTEEGNPTIIITDGMAAFLVKWN